MADSLISDGLSGYIVVSVTLIVLIFLVLILWRIKTKKKKSRTIETALRRQAGFSQINGNGVSGGIAGSLTDHLLGLKKNSRSRYQNGLSSRAGRIPYYFLIGHSESGKASLIENSGIKIQYDSLEDSDLRVHSDLNRCRSWLIDHTGFVKIPSKILCRDNHNDWVSIGEAINASEDFLRLRGLIVVISVEKMLALDVDALRKELTDIRYQLERISGNVKHPLSIHLIISKMDMVPGWTEIHSNLSDREREEVLGVELTRSNIDIETSQYLDQQLQKISLRTEIRAICQMSSKNEYRDQKKYIQFFKHDVLLYDRMRFLVRFFLESEHDSQGSTQGIYLVSSVQTNSMIDLISNDDIDHSLKNYLFDLLRSSKKSNNSFSGALFIHDLFRNKLLTECTARVFSKKNQKKIAPFSKFYIVSCLISVAFTSVMFGVYRTNSELIHKMSSWIIDSFEYADQKTSISASTAQIKLGQITKITEELEDVITLGFGSKDDIYDKLYTWMKKSRSSFLYRVSAKLTFESTEAVLKKIEQRYTALPDAVPSAYEYQSVYSFLKSYLLMTQLNDHEDLSSDGRGIASIEKDLRCVDDVIKNQDSEILRALLVLSYDSSEHSIHSIGEEESAVYASLFFCFLDSDMDYLFSRDSNLIQNVRSILGRVSYPSMLMERLLDSFDEEPSYALSLERIIGTEVSWWTTELKGREAVGNESYVRGFYTQRAWEDFFRDAIHNYASQHTEEDWVLERDSSWDLNDHSEVLRSIYLQRYIDEWHTFVDSITVNPPGTIEETLVMLEDLSRGNTSFLRHFFYHLQENTDLVDKTEDEERKSRSDDISFFDGIKQRLNKATQSYSRNEKLQGFDNPSISHILHVSDVRDSFSGINDFANFDDEDTTSSSDYLEEYLEQLVLLRESIRIYVDNPDEPSLIKSMMSTLQDARFQVKKLIHKQKIGWRPRLESILWPLLDGASSSIKYELARRISDRYCSMIVRPMTDVVTRRYPFDPTGHDVSLRDFESFLNPNDGVFWEAYNRLFTEIIEDDGRDFVFRDVFRYSDADSSDGWGNYFNESILVHLKSIKQLSDAFFSYEDDHASLFFDIRIQPSPDVHSIRLEIGGKSVEYRNEPESWIRMEWPGEYPVRGAVLTVRGADGMVERLEQEGEWGFFRLLEQGSPVTMTTQRTGFSNLWRFRTHQIDIQIDFRLSSRENPFFLNSSNDAVFMDSIRSRTVNPPLQILRDDTQCRFDP